MRAFPGLFCQANLEANLPLIREVLALAGWQMLAVESERPAVAAA